MQFHASTQQNQQAENILIPIPQTDNLSADLTAFLAQYNLKAEKLLQDFKANAKDLQVFYTEKSRIYFLGLGKEPTFKDLLKIARSFFFNQKNKIKNSLWIDAQHLTIDQIDGLFNGMLLSQYFLAIYKTDNQNKDTTFGFDTLALEIAVKPELLEAVHQVWHKNVIIAEIQRQMMDLVNLPPNKKPPKLLANWARQSAQKYDYHVHILDKRDLENQRFDALLAVAQGSQEPPFLIVTEHKPRNPLLKVGFVGKGITFDTGGLSIKESAGMYYMKSDMSGAASVLGTVELAARLNLPFHVIGVIPTAENSIDAKSFKPSDIIGSYLGKTIEIVDTDAEGRLILADGIAYLNRTFQPDILIDIATLTGNCIAALGYEAAGLFTNNPELAQALLKAGEQTGERLWQLPLWDSYKDEILSDMADLKNYNGKPYAGAITAAKFLEVFTENHPKYAHLDIAGVAFGDSEFAKSKIATAFGIRLFYQFLLNLQMSLQPNATP
ncbi:MAG: leucyl aminopeptidase [Microscillaceae bacterium]|nr:leucyl aminopeptidase [Microscillaceae bacterium]MDW8461318.1 leucyl aminopeptidase [Cytophagales bacterium]